jgi:glyoxylase-like metal-dependent hydrolase (beta-lactamase superfamily II)
MKRRSLLVVGVLALLLPAAVAGGVVLSTVTGLSHGGQRVKGPHGLVGVYTGASYAWLVPAGDGVVLVDAGPDPLAPAVQAELAGRQVLAVLLTHAHVDHFAGVDAFADAPLIYGEEEDGLVKGLRLPGGLVASWAERAGQRPRLPEQLRPVPDGEVFTVGTARFRAVAVPGHTHGSTAYQWRDVVFVGDAVLGTDPLLPSPSMLTADVERAQASVANLLPLDVQWIADGHVGLRGGAREALAAFVGVEPGEPEWPLADDPPVVRHTLTGRYVQRPVPDGRGLAPAELVADDGRRWVISSMPVDGHRALWQRRVRVTGVEEAVAPGVRAVGGPWLKVASIEAVDEEPPGVQRRSAHEAVTELEHGWVEVHGLLDGLAPLAERASRGEGAIDGVPLVAPMDAGPLVGQPVTLLARVSEGTLLVAAVCPGDVAGCGRPVSEARTASAPPRSSD